MNHTTWCDTCALVHTEKKGTFMCFCACHAEKVEIADYASGKITANGIKVAAPTTDTSELSKFIRNASPEEKERVWLEIAKQASADQRAAVEDTGDWRESPKAKELRDYIDKVFKPRKVGIQNLDREIIVDFCAKELKRARRDGLYEKEQEFIAHFEAGRQQERARVREKLEAFKHKGQTKNTFSHPQDAFHAGRRRGRNDVVRELLDAFKD